jgi:hypothetical protein
MLQLRLVAGFVIFLTTTSIRAQDAKEIVRKALVIEIDRQRKLDNYTWEVHEVEKKLDSSNQIKKTTTRAYEHWMLDGSDYRRLVVRDGQTLSGGEAQKEQVRMDAEIAKRHAETTAQRANRQARHKRNLDEAIKFREEVLQAFAFRIAGEESLKGMPCWRIQAEPNKSFVPLSREGKLFLGKVHGTIWVTKEGLNWVKIDAETIGKITFGGFLASVTPGAHIGIEQFRVNSELWHPERIQIAVNARALLTRMHEEIELQFRNFRKFQTESKLVAVEGESK